MVGLSSLKDKFSKKKEVAPSKPLPETAKDIYGDVNIGPPPERPTEVPAPKEPVPDLPDVTFAPKKEHQIIPDKPEEIPTVEEEMMFEDAVNAIPPSEAFIDTPDYEKEETKTEVQNNDAGFFSEFQRFLDGNEIPKVANDIVGKDLVEKMKEFHSHKEEGKPYYFHPEELKKALNKNLIELRNLERDWFTHKKRIAHEESMLAEKEEELAEKVEEVKHMLHQIKVKDDFGKEIPEEKQFKLFNDQKIKSLAGLATALSVMDESVFKSHVSVTKNDFASWVRAVLKNEDLGNALYECKTKDEMIKALAKYEKGE